MTNSTAYSDPEDDFETIVLTDPQLQELVDDEDRAVDLSDETDIIVEDDRYAITENHPDFWSDR